jgi:hypothetical protein
MLPQLALTFLQAANSGKLLLELLVPHCLSSDFTAFEALRRIDGDHSLAKLVRRDMFVELIHTDPSYGRPVINVMN